MKEFFKRKSVIISLSLFLAGTIALCVMMLLPKSNTYTSLMDMEIFGLDTVEVIKFQKDKKVKVYYKYEDGTESEGRISNYEIKHKTLYIDGVEKGRIDVFGIYVYGVEVNGTKINTGYECKPAIIAKYVAFVSVGIGAVIFIFMAYTKFLRNDGRDMKMQSEAEEYETEEYEEE